MKNITFDSGINSMRFHAIASYGIRITTIGGQVITFLFNQYKIDFVPHENTLRVVLTHNS